MKCDLVFAGVGGQGILLPSAILARSAMQDGLHARQSEVHGMAQRGGAVESHLRLSDTSIYSELIPEGRADLILSMEPLESLRYLRYLSPHGV
jgi:indolepyruvate ferredoxin oxidoreductase beta subunit